MKKTLKIFFFIQVLALLVMSCASTKHSAKEKQNQQDSVRVEYRQIIVTVPDTVIVEIPKQTAERTTPDSVSHLENDYALSDARINADGTLFHSLETKPQLKPIPTEKQIVYRDSIRDRWHYETKTETKEVEVEKALSWWEQTQLKGFWVLLLVLAIIYRKNIFSLILHVIQRK